MSSSFLLQLDAPRPTPSMSARLLTSLKRPFSKPKPDPYPALPPERSREQEAGAAPPNYEQIIMGLHLSRTPHIPAHLAHLYPPAPQSSRHPQQQLEQQHPHRESSSSPTPTSSSSAPPRRRTRSQHLHPLPSSSSSSSRLRARLPPPPARSAMKKPRVASRSAASSVTPDTASASTVASSVHPSTPTRPGLLARFLGAKERRAASSLVVVVVAEHEAELESGPERKAVRFGGVEEEGDES